MAKCTDIYRQNLKYDVNQLISTQGRLLNCVWHPGCGTTCLQNTFYTNVDLTHSINQN